MKTDLVALVNPPSSLGTVANREGAAGLGNVYPLRQGVPYPPQTIAYVAAAARNHGYRVQVMDAVLSNYTLSMIVHHLEALEPDVIGVFVSHATFDADVAFVNVLKARLPESRIIVFGPVTRFRTEELAQESLADVVLLGEAEGYFPQACDDLLAKRSVEEWDEVGSQSRVLGDREGFVEQIEELPFPAWDLVDRSKLWRLSLSASRGCAEKCSYCPYVAAQGPRIRTRPTESIMEELQYLIRALDTRYLVFRDPAFAASRESVMMLCEQILRSGLIFRWECESRPEHFDHEMIALMKRAGCQEIKIGLETADEGILVKVERVRDETSARVHAEKTAKVVESCRLVGLRCRVFAMVGLPGQTCDSVDLTASFIEEIRPRALNVKSFEAYPGIRLAAFPSGQEDSGERLYQLREGIEQRESLANRISRPGILSRRGLKRRIESLGLRLAGR
ncbi:MAG: radical SAM protein [Dehalococcoidales bacterium]|nr:radical SAM protein [Dehalococcoidales bacterium]